MIQALDSQVIVTQQNKTQKGYMNFVSEMKYIAYLIYNGGNNPDIKKIAMSIIPDKQIKLNYATAGLLHNWVRDNIRYAPDVAGLESLQEPLVTYNNKYGDCDDMTILLCSLCKSIGFDTGIVAVNINSEYFSHIYSIVNTDSGWFYSDTTGLNNPFGFEANVNMYSKKYFLFFE